MKYSALLVGACAILSTPTMAQEMALDDAVETAVEVDNVATAAAEAAVTPVQMTQIVLPPNTEIMVTPVEEFTSKKNKEGTIFDIKTVFDVMQDGVVVIPKSTYGKAEMTWRTGKGVFGKSAKMEVTFRSLDLGGGRTLPLTGKHRQEGRGNTGATAGVVLATGLVGGLFVTGRSAIMPAGQQVLARSAESMTFEVASNTSKQIYAKPKPAEVAVPVSVATDPASVVGEASDVADDAAQAIKDVFE